MSAESEDPLQVALFEAAQTGDLALCSTLLEAMCDPNVTDDQMTTPIIVATQHSHLDIVQYLYSNGANPAHENVLGMSALSIAQETALQHKGDDKIYQFLMSKMSLVSLSSNHVQDIENEIKIAKQQDVDDVPFPSSDSADSCSYCHRKTKTRVLCPDCNRVAYCSPEHLTTHWTMHRKACIPSGYTAEDSVKQSSHTGEMLRQSALEGKHTLVKECLEAKIDVNYRQGNGWTAMMGAASQGHISIMNTLILAQADLNVRDDLDGTTALIRATFYNKSKAVEWLIKRGADINIKGPYNKTALDWAREREFSESEELLITATLASRKNQSIRSNEENMMMEKLQLERMKKELELSRSRLQAEQEEILQERKRLASVEQGHEEALDSQICRICFENEINCVLLPCRHFAICEQCSSYLKSCPICRKPIDQVTPFFRA